MTENSGENQATMPGASDRPMPALPKKCTYCDTAMAIHARVCANCNRDERWYLNYFRIGDLLLLVSILVSFGMVYFSYRNFHESREERLKASQALELASNAENIVKQGMEQFRQLQISNEEGRKLVDDLSHKNAQAERQMGSLKNTIQEGTTAVKELQNYALLTSTVVAAQGDERRAYDQLWAWSKDESCKFKKEAAKAMASIMQQYDRVTFLPTFQWKEGIDPRRLSLTQLAYDYRIQIRPDMRSAILLFVWQRTDIPKKDRLSFLVEVMRDDPSIRVVNHAGTLFEEATGDGYKSLAIADHLKWWKENKDNL